MLRFPVIVGLGNPGKQYADTRHNVGFMILDRIARSAGVDFQSEAKWQCHLAKLADGTLLLKPQSFMNLSGHPVRTILSFLKIPASDILVVFDDASLPLGGFRFREKGSAGGHNGIKSLIEHLGTPDFPRLKVGIGAANPGNMTGHVLGKFSPDELPILENTLASSTEAIQLARSQGIAAAANQFHNPKTPTESNESDESQIPRPDRPEHEIPRRQH